MDGLLCTTDVREKDEDEAGLNVGNWGCSIARAGWGSAGHDVKGSVWAASDMETVSLWNDEVCPPALELELFVHSATVSSSSYVTLATLVFQNFYLGGLQTISSTDPGPLRLAA